MRIQLGRFITGLIYVVILKNEKSRNENGVSAATCPEKQVGSVLVSDCSRKNLIDVPQDLKMEIKELDVSYNPIQALTADVFKRYKGLTVLRMMGLTTNKKIQVHESSFSVMNDLEILDLSDSPFHMYADKVNWPTKLRILYLGKLEFRTLDLSQLIKLERLNVSNNNLTSLPKFHPEAPLIWLDIYDNPLNDLSAEDLAPFCKLKYFRARILKGGILDSPLKVCNCTRANKWLETYGIEGSELTCAPDLSKRDPNCKPDTFGPQVMKLRQDCLDRLPTSSFWKWLIFLLLFSLLVPIAYIANEAYKSYKIKKGLDEPPASPTEPGALPSDTEVTTEPNQDPNKIPSQGSE